MTAQRKIYLALLVVAGFALVIDQALLEGGGSGPDEAAGAAAIDAAREDLLIEPQAVTGVERAMAQVERTIARLEDEHSVAHRLGRLADAFPLPVEEAADAFALPPHWREARAVEEEQVVSGEEGGPAERFEQEHQLQALIHSGDGAGFAIVNDRPVRIGDRVGGFTLTRIDEDRARFERDGLTASLRLEREAAAAFGGLGNQEPAVDDQDD